MNGKIVVAMKNKTDLNHLLEVSPSSVRVVVMHEDDDGGGHRLELEALGRELEVCRTRVEEAERSRRAYKTDNVRLSHRVSYLEDQVSELIKCRSAGGVQLFQRGANSAMVRSKSPKHGVSAIQQYKRKQQTVYDDRPTAVQAEAAGPAVKTRIRTVPPRSYGCSSAASIESLVSSAADPLSVAVRRSHDDLYGGGGVSPKRNNKRSQYPIDGDRNSNRTRHIREAQQTLFRFLDSESSGAPYLQQCGAAAAAAAGTTVTGTGSVRSLDADADDSQHHLVHHRRRLKSTDYYSHVNAAAAADGSPRPVRSLNYDSEQSGRRAPMPPKKPLRLSLQQRQRGGHNGKSDDDDAATAAVDDVDLSAINNTVS